MTYMTTFENKMILRESIFKFGFTLENFGIIVRFDCLLSI